jgi:hypothetical protein
MNERSETYNMPCGCVCIRTYRDGVLVKIETSGPHGNTVRGSSQPTVDGEHTPSLQGKTPRGD